MRYEETVSRETVDFGDILVLGDNTLRLIAKSGNTVIAIDNGVLAIERDTLQEIEEFYRNNYSFGGIVKILKCKNIIVSEEK